jgi:phosphatidylserine/phosphatidylglycerophosphate/cardiolipin synthase-like enzyme
VVTNHEVALSWIGFGSVMTTAARATYQDVLAFNQEQDAPDLISIFEWGSDPLLHNGEGQNHAKYAVIDGLYSVVGSYNFDPRARHLNSENIGIFASANLAATLTAEIEEYIQPFYSVPVTWEDALSYQQPDTNMGKIKNQILDILTPYL